MKHIDIRNMIVGALIGAVITLSIGAGNGPASKWEYKVRTEHNYDAFAQQLNEEGRSGWEVAGFSVDERAGVACALLKRPAR
jgi:hypothetical protein